MRTPDRLKWPLAPLVAKAGWNCPACHMNAGYKDSNYGVMSGATEHCGSLEHLARRMNIDSGPVYRARREGLTDARAEEYAYLLGYYPNEIWGYDWFEAVLRDAVRADFYEFDLPRILRARQDRFQRLSRLLDRRMAARCRRSPRTVNSPLSTSRNPQARKRKVAA